MDMEIRLLGAGDVALLERTADGVFDAPVQDHLAREFLADARHHLAVAIDRGVVVGMASAVDYIHPDKEARLWINEIGVAPTHQRKGIGRLLLDSLLDHGRALGCTEAWLGTEVDNVAARRLYESAGGRAEPFVLYSFPLEGKSR